MPTRPRCDVFWNNEILNTIRLQEKGLLEPYNSLAGDAYPAMYRAADGTWREIADAPVAGGKNGVWIGEEVFVLGEDSGAAGRQLTTRSVVSLRWNRSYTHDRPAGFPLPPGLSSRRPGPARPLTETVAASTTRGALVVRARGAAMAAWRCLRSA